MYKLVTVDLDGTLLDKGGNISPYTKEIFNQILEKNVEVIIASGRPISSTKNIAKELNCKNFFVAGNGSIIYDIKKDEIIYGNFIKKEKVLKIIKLCEENSIYYNLYTTKAIIAKSLKNNVLYYHKENQSKSEQDKTQINIVNDIYEYIKESDEQVLKITICDENKAIFESIIKKLKQIKQIEILDVEHASRKIIKDGTNDVAINYYYTEIMVDGVNKWTAIDKILEAINVSKEEVIAIGDNVNDKEMIENAGLGIAMKGSTPEITNVAKKITEFDNANDGVAKELEGIFLKQL